MLSIKFTAGELLVRFCRSALQARIAAESRLYSKIFALIGLTVTSGIYTGQALPCSCAIIFFTLQSILSGANNEQYKQGRQSITQDCLLQN